MSLKVETPHTFLIHSAKHDLLQLKYIKFVYHSYNPPVLGKDEETSLVQPKH